MTGGQVTGDASARWLTSERFDGFDVVGRRTAEAQLAAIRDRVLDNAQLTAGHHVVDLGAGNGLLTLGALDRVGTSGAVSAVDLSSAALDMIRPPAGGGRLSRVVADVTGLPLPNGVADAVVTRSVLIYVPDLRGVLNEAARVLKPDGRLSVFEPVNARRSHDAVLEGLTPDELAAITGAVAGATPAATTMHAFDEKKAAVMLVVAGFTDISLSLADTRTVLAGRTAVAASLRRPGHPGAPSTLATVARELGADLARRYEDAWRAAADRGSITWTTPGAYLTATRTAHR